MLFSVRPPYLLKKIMPTAIWRGSATDKKLYLTFDDGPIPELTPWVLDVLKYNAIKATFFCVGENVCKHSDVYTRILNEGHQVGNHTYNHLNGWNTDTNAYVENTKKCASFVSSNLFRPPYGKLKPTQIKQLKSNYTIVMWDVLSGDYDKTITPERCYLNVINSIRNGSIIVFHDNLKAQVNLRFALPKVIAYALEQGYEFDVL
ncbi:MAG: polysaccharide deacetylase family protein [Bacteroidia bacterium]